MRFTVYKCERVSLSVCDSYRMVAFTFFFFSKLMLTVWVVDWLVLVGVLACGSVCNITIQMLQGRSGAVCDTRGRVIIILYDVGWPKRGEAF